MLALAPPNFALAPRTPTFPTVRSKCVVGFAAGGSTDVAARIMAQKMGEILGQTILVENRPGASGLLAAEDVIKSPPDGYTLMMASQTVLAVAPKLDAQGDDRSGERFCADGLLRRVAAGAGGQSVVSGAHHCRDDRDGEGGARQDHFRHRRRRHHAAYRVGNVSVSTPGSR